MDFIRSAIPTVSVFAQFNGVQGRPSFFSRTLRPFPIDLIDLDRISLFAHRISTNIELCQQHTYTILITDHRVTSNLNKQAWPLNTQESQQHHHTSERHAQRRATSQRNKRPPTREERREDPQIPSAFVCHLPLVILLGYGLKRKEGEGIRSRSLVHCTIPQKGGAAPLRRSEV